jgi:arylsulfatase A-like enzyme
VPVGTSRRQSLAAAVTRYYSHTYDTMASRRRLYRLASHLLHSCDGDGAAADENTIVVEPPMMMMHTTAATTTRTTASGGGLSETPNCIVFFTDQQRWDTSELAGNPQNLTPNYDRMAQRGTHMPSAVTCQPVCGPARSAMQTGMWPTATGCFRNGIGLPADCPKIAELFRDAGWSTGYIGKWHMYSPATGVNPGGRGTNLHPSRSQKEAYEASRIGRGAVPREERCGYDYWLASNMLEFTSEPYQTTLYDSENRPVRLPGYRADACTDAAIRFISEHAQQKPKQPFFLFISFIEPHHQNRTDDYPAPLGYQQHFQRDLWVPPDLAELGGTANQHLAGYYGMVKRLDECLGRLQDALHSLGIARDTVLMQTCDHGCHFKTRNREYKRSCHESSVRIPAAIQGACFDGGGLITDPVTLLDFAPTLLDACGIEVPVSMHGRSVLPLMELRRPGHTIPSDWPTEQFIQISESQIGRAVRTRRWKYGIDAPDAQHWLEPKGSGAMVYEEQYLYDLQTDPYELRNLIGWPSHFKVADICRQRLLRRMSEAGEATPEIRPATEKTPNHGTSPSAVRDEEAMM